MTRLVIVGAGGHGKVVADSASSQGRWSSVSFVDDRPGARQDVLGLSIVGTTADISRLVDGNTEIVVAIGDGKRRLELLLDYHRLGYPVVTVTHPAATVSRFSEVGAGSVIFAGAVIQPGAVLGLGCIVSTGATVDHDCSLGNVVHVCPGAHLAGNVVVGTGSWLGVGSAVRHGIRIGEWAMIGAGAAVVAHVPDGTTAMGVPARAAREGM